VRGHLCLGCKEGGQRTYRHDAVRNAIFQVSQASGLSASLEVPPLLAGCSKRPADIFLRDFSHGKNLALDVTVSNTMQNTNLSKACVETGFHATDAADRKRQAFHKVAPNSTFILLPLSFETLGGMTQETEDFLTRLAGFWAARQCMSNAEAVGKLFQRVSVALQRGNSEMIIKHLPIPPSRLYGRLRGLMPLAG